VETLKWWNHYLNTANYKILIWCDYNNLEWFQRSNILSTGQARWTDILPAYDILIEDLEGTQNSASDPSSRLDYQIGYERPVAQLSATTSVVSWDDPKPAVITAQASDSLTVDNSAKLVHQTAADGTNTMGKLSQW